jgi:tetrahydromethanopterin S-methyltransferase subunit D
MKKILTIALSLLTSTICIAQEKPEMADVMRSNGKIYTVVAVCVTILLGLFAYVFNIDRKISKIEKKQN